jgi:hypothetical protein
VWRGVAFAPVATATAGLGFFSSPSVAVAGDRSSDWKCQRLQTVWHARLRIGGDRFPGVGATPELALDAAAEEAIHVASLISGLVPVEAVKPRKASNARARKGRA